MCRPPPRSCCWRPRCSSHPRAETRTPSRRSNVHGLRLSHLENNREFPIFHRVPEETANRLCVLSPHLQIPVVVSTRPKLDLVSVFRAATHSKDIADAVVTDTRVSQSGHREEELSVAKSVSLKEGDLKSSSLRLHSGYKRVIWIPGHSGLELQAR